MTRVLAKPFLLCSVIALLVVGCGDDGGDGGDAVTPSPDEIEDALDDAVDAPDVDVCSLLEVSEIEAEFGDAGVVSEGQENLDQCSWEVGEDQSELGTGSVHVFVQYLDPSLPIDSIEDVFADSQSSTPDAVSVEGIGDEAYYAPNGASVNARSGDLIWFVQAAFLPEPDGIQEKVETLAALVAERL